MTHPFPRNIALLRRIYADRFSALRFILPFERMADEDVITVYRGSYVHAAYLTDARMQLAAIDCDFYMVVQDDVLLNPKISDDTFFDYFDLQPTEGFIPFVGPPSPRMGDWVWLYGFIAKLLFPKSILFGAGIELTSLVQYLPSAEKLEECLERSGVSAARTIRLDASDMSAVAAEASRLLLHGLAQPLENDARQRDIEARSFRIEQELVEIMLAAHRIRAGDAAGDLVPLPAPMLQSGYYADLYIVPRPGFDDFCHYMGVAGAANLFVEISAPTALFASCSRVRQAPDLGLDCAGFDRPLEPDWFMNPKALAIHPVKLSVFDTEERRNSIVELLAAVRDDRSDDVDRLVQVVFGTRLTRLTRTGWNGAEHWGTWTAASDAELEIPLKEPADLRLRLRAPVHAKAPEMKGQLSFGRGRAPISFVAEWPSEEVVVEVERLAPDADGVARLTLSSDRLIVPAELGEGSLDRRSLGFGLAGASWGTITARPYAR